MSSLYIHIPFCLSRCIYCGFYSTTLLGAREAYIDAVLQELNDQKRDLFARPATIYYGGGTPSALTVPQLQRLTDGIRESVDTSGVTEWTMECNPDDITPELCQWLRESPINRVSMGVQTFCDTRLRWLHRRHTAAQARTAVRLLREAGIENISLDLMFGFPGESLAEWHHDVAEAVKLCPEHISAYSLMYDDGTPLTALRDVGRVTEIDDELSRTMYDTVCDLLHEAGYRHYEISNFTLPTRESRHNSAYWDQTPYLGIGAAAHSYDGGRRWWNVSDLSRYIATTAEGHTERGSELIDERTRYNDIITTALRRASGIRLDSLPTEQKMYLLAQATPHVTAHRLSLSHGCLHLTQQGIYTSDDIMADLIKD